MSDDKVKGPASYFPAIEAKYGHPVSYWLSLVTAMEGTHMARVARLKAEHGVGHGHANALVGYALKETPR